MTSLAMPSIKSVIIVAELPVYLVAMNSLANKKDSPTSSNHSIVKR
jgi:hypothetical protein